MSLLSRLTSEAPGHAVDLGQSAPGLGRVIGVTGSTGAPGRTFVSINLALGLALAGQRVALVDADPHLGAIAVQLGLAEDRSLAYLEHEAALTPVSEALVAQHLQQTRGLDVLAGRTTSPQAVEAGGAVLEPVLARLRSEHDLVVVDVGALDCPAAQASALLCQLLVWVVTPTRLGLDLLDRTLCGQLAAPVRLRPSLALVNRLGELALREADRSLRQRYGMAFLGAVPEHLHACRVAEEEGRPAVLAGPLARQLRRISDSLLLALARPTAAGGDGAGSR